MSEKPCPPDSLSVKSDTPERKLECLVNQLEYDKRMKDYKESLPWWQRILGG